MSKCLTNWVTVRLKLLEAMVIQEVSVKLLVGFFICYLISQQRHEGSIIMPTFKKYLNIITLFLYDKVCWILNKRNMFIFIMAHIPLQEQSHVKIYNVNYFIIIMSII